VVFRPASHRQPTLQRRKAVLRAALEVIAERGIGKATHRAIASRAGVPLSTTSYFFASIDELIVAALHEFTEATIKRMESVADLVSAGRLSPQAALDRFTALILAIPPEQSGAQFELYLEVRRRPELAADARRLLEAYETLVQKALEAAGATNSRTAARAFVALSDGITLQRFVWPRGIEDQRALREGLRVLLAGFSAKPTARTETPDHGEPNRQGTVETTTEPTEGRSRHR
jgi:DNA-binding transcriptional regulator YbjK